LLPQKNTAEGFGAWLILDGGELQFAATRPQAVATSLVSAAIATFALHGTQGPHPPHHRQSGLLFTSSIRNPK